MQRRARPMGTARFQGVLEWLPHIEELVRTLRVRDQIRRLGQAPWPEFISSPPSMTKDWR